MKKRLRKKGRLGEFYELILHVNGKFSKTLTKEEIDNFLDEMCDFVDEIGCTFIGVTNEESFHHSYMGLYKYRNRLTREQTDMIWRKLDGYGFTKFMHFKIIKTTEMED